MWFVEPRCDCFYDHPVRWIHRASRRKCYVSEPYRNNGWGDDHDTQSHAQAWADKHGFHVTISEPLSVYYPGATRAVIFYRGFNLDDLVELSTRLELERAAHA